MSTQDQRDKRANTLLYLHNEHLLEGLDWYWGTAHQWGGYGVIDAGRTIEVIEHVWPKDQSAMPIMIRSSGVRKLGGLQLAKAMEIGEMPSEMPFALGKMPNGWLC